MPTVAGSGSIVFDEDTGFPPPGRTRTTLDEAEQALVASDRFQESATRRDLWTNLERYLARFLTLEDRYRDRVGEGSLLHCLWLGGSFVSTKVDPRNIDMTVIVDGPVRAAIKGNPGAGWLADAFHRDRIAEEFQLSPLELVYWPVVSVFRPRMLESHEQDYLRGRGSWDDWWQRCRADGHSMGPSPDTVHVRRGYLEVVL